MTWALRRRRNSPALFAIRLAESATATVPTLLVWVSVRAHRQVWFGVPVDVIFGLVSGIVIMSLVADWWMTRFTVDLDGVSFEKGLLVRRATSLAWSEVVSVQVSRSAACRALGCARVLIGIGAASKANLVIEAVPEAVATEIEGYFTAGRDRPVSGTHRPVEDGVAEEVGSTSGLVDRGEVRESETDDLLYRIRVRDYLMLSVTYGQFVLVVPFVFGLYENIAHLSSLFSVLPTLPDQAMSLRVLAVVILLVAAPVAVGFGMSVAWLRYRSFEVRLREGVFAMSGGLVSAESRQVSRSQVVGVKIQQNPLMRVTGYARLSFVSRQSGERIGANVVFPAVRLAFLRDKIRTHFPAYAVSVDRSCRVGRRLGWGLIGVDAAVLVLAGVALDGMSLARVVTIMTVLAIALLVATNYCWAAAELDPDNAVISFRRGFLWVTHYVIPCGSVYFVESHRVSLAGRLSVATLCMGVYDSRAVRLWVPVGRPGLLDQFIEGNWTPRGTSEPLTCVSASQGLMIERGPIRLKPPSP